MISTRWLKERRPYWQRLEELLDHADTRSLRALSHYDLQELGLLYRQATTDLATLRQDHASMTYSDALNQLVVRAHHTIYAAEKRQPVALVRAFVRNYPAVVRRNIRYVAAATLLFLAGGLVGAVLTWRDPELKLRVLGPEMMETINRHQMWTHSIVAIKPIASSQIMTNNISVSLTAFAMGALGAVGTVYMMFFNGFLMGVIGAACAAAGLSLSLWSFVVGHGSLEIPSILLAGGAGLRLGHGVLFPGTLPRRMSIVRAGHESLTLALGCVPLLVVAGVVEAFVSPTDVAVPVKFALGIALFAMLTTYLLWPARSASTTTALVP